jgi:hypothetical protein
MIAIVAATAGKDLAAAIDQDNSNTGAVVRRAEQSGARCDWRCEILYR